MAEFFAFFDTHYYPEVVNEYDDVARRWKPIVADSPEDVVRIAHNELYTKLIDDDSLFVVPFEHVRVFRAGEVS